MYILNIFTYRWWSIVWRVCLHSHCCRTNDCVTSVISNCHWSFFEVFVVLITNVLRNAVTIEHSEWSWKNTCDGIDCCCSCSRIQNPKLSFRASIRCPQCLTLFLLALLRFIRFDRKLFASFFVFTHQNRLFQITYKRCFQEWMCFSFLLAGYFPSTDLLRRTVTLVLTSIRLSIASSWLELSSCGGDKATWFGS